jgi:hypothetical protein
MSQPPRFPFVQTGTGQGTSSLAPLLPISLVSSHATVHAMGLLDTGATVSVMPHDLGLQLGLDWNLQQRYPLQLTGNLGGIAARGVAVDAIVSPFAAVRQVFAWVQTSSVPLILGRVNFFLEFDVCFFMARACFDVQPKQ